MSIAIAKCRFCSKTIYGEANMSKRKPSVQIITCKDCRDKLPKDDYIGKFLER